MIVKIRIQYRRSFRMQHKQHKVPTLCSITKFIVKRYLNKLINNDTLFVKIYKFD